MIHNWIGGMRENKKYQRVYSIFSPFIFRVYFKNSLTKLRVSRQLTWSNVFTQRYHVSTDQRQSLIFTIWRKFEVDAIFCLLLFDLANFAHHFPGNVLFHRRNTFFPPIILTHYWPNEIQSSQTLENSKHSRILYPLNLKFLPLYLRNWSNETREWQ